MRCRRLSGLLVVPLAVAAGAASPPRAAAADGVSPAGTTIEVAVDASGYVTSPAAIELVLRLDPSDRLDGVWAADAAGRTGAGLPTGTVVGSCAPAQVSAGAGPGTSVCRVSTILLKPGRTYWWWVDYTRSGTSMTAGPYSFTLAAPGAPPPAPSTFADASSVARLPSSPRWEGTRSVEDTTLARTIYRTMKEGWKGPPRRLAVACWTQPDFDALIASNGRAVSDGVDEVLGVWLRYEPHWLHLGAGACGWVQRLIDTRAASAKTAFGLVVALHEALHAYGVDVEARANCYAVQLVPTAARVLGLPARRAAYLGQLAVRFTRSTAPPRYWDAARCRDGGAWDIEPRTANLR